MKIVDDQKRKKTTKKKQRHKRAWGNISYSERVRAKWFCCAFKLDFFQFIDKGSLILKLNLEIALSIILKQRELYEPKHAVVERNV